MNTSPTVERGIYVLYKVPEAAHPWVGYALRHIFVDVT
jgi:hypothetical protein